MNNNLVGTGVALITPFTSDGEVDYKGLDKLVNHAVQIGVDYLVLLGTTAEVVTLNKEEKKQVVAAIKNSNKGRLPLVIGIGGNSTRAVVEEIQQTDLSDFTAILSVSPAYNKPTQEGIYQHFKAIAQSTEKDIILYNVPGRTSSNIEPETTLRLAQDFKNIVAIKEASPNYSQASTILQTKPQDFMLLSGDDEYALPLILAGASGVISVIGQCMEEYPKMIDLAMAGKIEESYALFYEKLALIRAIYKEGNPAGVKALAEHLGLCTRQTRLPLIPATESLSKEILAYV